MNARWLKRPLFGNEPQVTLLAKPLAVLILTGISTAQAQSVIGEAYAMDGSAIRYLEEHRCAANGEECVVEYRYPEGEVFARKRVDYRPSMQAPGLKIEDLRAGETLVIESDFEDDVVVDAGFDHYVRLRWDELAGGEEVRFPFLVAGRDKPLNMRAQLEDEVECAQSRLCLTITLDNWLLSALVSPIRLEYDETSRRLLQFEGVSNIRDDDGKSQQVRIDYRYQDEAADTAS
ncbi:MAG: hypothetical protein ABJN62_09890 [Halioglobus sp.]